MSERVLVVGPSWVGDMVMAQSLFMTLAAERPGVETDVLAPGWSLPLIARMREVREGIEMPLGHGEFAWGVRRRLGVRLRERGYDQAIVLPRSFKSALVPFHARIPRRTGYRGETRYWLINDMRPMDDTVLTQTVQRFVALGRAPDADQPPPVPRPRLAVDAANQARLAAEYGLEGEGPAVAMMPGAEYGPAKCWPLEHFGETARALAARGARVWLLGSKKDRPSGEAIAAASGGTAVNLCGLTRLEDAVDLLALAGQAVTNDSGLMHVAAAAGCRVIALYGSTTPDYTPPLTDAAKVLYLGLECSPCFERVCPLGHFRCLKDIHPDRVLAELRLP